MLRIEKSELVYVAQFFSSFSNRVTVRNPSPGTSLPGTVRLTSLDPAFKVDYPLAAIPGGSNTSVIVGGSANFRSEEHTSELQSQSNLVCRLLLEKKNNKKI